MIAAIFVKVVFAILIAEIVLWFILAFIHRNDEYNY